MRVLQLLLLGIAASLSTSVILTQLPIASAHPGKNDDSISVSNLSISQQSTSSQHQQTSLSLSAANLARPHILSICTAGTQLTGKLDINGKVIKQFNRSHEQIDMRPYLSVGEHVITISAHSSPAAATIEFEFSGPGTSVVQQTRGQGKLNHILALTVR